MDEKRIEIEIFKDYYEIYSPFPQDPKEAENKIKREMMKKAGFSDKEIDRFIDIFELQYDGADGFEDNPYTSVSLVKIIDREPPGGGPKPPPEDDEKEPSQKPRQTMLQQYYGDRKAEANRREKFARFKSHIVQKSIQAYDKDGKSKTIQVYTIDDYPEKEEDTDELLLYGYSTRLERLSRAHQGDFAPYEVQYNKMIDHAKAEIRLKYHKIIEENPSQANELKKEAEKIIANLSTDEEARKEGIQALIDKDTDFIETNNYGYNSHQNTQENLRTLGKFGEKSVKAPISVEQSFATKFGLHFMNALIEIRNHTTAPVNQAIGTFVASPIHRLLTGTKRVKSEPVNVDGYFITPMEDMIATSQKNSVGMFKNKFTHRYQARKDYFTQMISREEQERLMSTEKGYGKDSVKRTTPRTLLKLAILPRLMALFHYKEGNIAVLNAGLHDIEIATKERNEKLFWKKDELQTLKYRIKNAKNEIKDLEELLKVVKDPYKQEAIQKGIELRKTQIPIYTGKFIEKSRIEVDSVQTDALSMSQHDKANKSDITKVVKGFKTAGRIAVGAFISRFLYKEVAHQAKTPDTQEYVSGKKEYIPAKTEFVDKTVEKTVLVPGTKLEPGLDKEGVANITLDKIYSQGSGKLYYSVYGGQKGNTLEDNSSFFRGIEFTYNGQSLSGSDGHGFDATALTTVQLSQDINGETSIVNVVQDVLQNAIGKPFTKEEVEQLILDGKVSDIDIWRSNSENGIPLGWLRASEIVPEMIKEGSHEVPTMVEKVVKETVKEAVTTPGYMQTTPGHWVQIPGEEYTYFTSEINPSVVAGLSGLSALEASNWNDLLRYTRSQESIKERATEQLKAMARENKAKNNGKEITIKVEKATINKRRIKSFQRNNKDKIRYYWPISDTMNIHTKKLSEKRKGVTVFEKFMGTKEEDFKSGYDENAIGANNIDSTKNINLEEEDTYDK